MNLVGTVHYADDYDNAFWDGSQMIYGDGDGDVFKTFVLIDVIGHEMSHGVTQFTSNLDYEGQSGAFNEHFSDVMGVLVRQFTNKLTCDQDSWLIGPGIFTKSVKGRALRDMLNPGTAYDDPRLGKDPQPSDMSGYVQTFEDNGGIHLNRVVSLTVLLLCLLMRLVVMLGKLPDKSGMRRTVARVMLIATLILLSLQQRQWLAVRLSIQSMLASL